MRFAYAWEYKVLESHVEAFKLAYGHKGEWVRLFRRDPAYIRTEILSDLSDSKRFLTIDYWTTRQAFLTFRERLQTEFDAVDNRCAQYTIEERHLGDFDLAD